MLSRLRLKGVAELNNLRSPSVLTLDHSKRQFVVVCLHSSTELVALTTSWDSKEPPGPQDVSEQDKMEVDVMEPSKPVPMETSDAMETSTKKKCRTKRRSSDEYVRRSARLQAKKLASLNVSVEEPPQETRPVIVPVEATERFVRELRESGNYTKLGELPGVSSTCVFSAIGISHILRLCGDSLPRVYEYDSLICCIKITCLISSLF